MKNKIINGLVLVSPVVVGLFYLIKVFGLYVSKSILNDISTKDATKVSVYEILYIDHQVTFARVIVIISLAILALSIMGMIGAYVYKQKKSLLLKTSLVCLLASVALLEVCFVTSLFPIKSGNVTTFISFDFMTLPFLILIVGLSILTYFLFKTKKD